ncbi:MAG: SH3 domain-containing protein [Lachnospiraceae bacterium]|nr:SH3 domain-containing protein [Lachnospiraceae bacterium]
MVPYKKKKKKVPVWPVLAVVAVLLTVAVILEVRPSTEHADLDQYFASRSGSLAVITNDVLSHEDAIIEDGAVYLSPSYLLTINARFYLDETEEILLYTLPDKTVWADTGSAFEGHPVLRKTGGVLYVLMDYVAQYTDMAWKLYTGPDRLVIRTAFGEQDILTAEEDIAIRKEARVSSPIMATLAAGEKVRFLKEQSKWYYVCTEDGIEGYIAKTGRMKAGKETLSHVYTEPVYEAVSTRQDICLVWHQIAYRDIDNGKLGELMAEAKGVTVVSPTWFFLTDGEGGFDNASSAAYVEQAHAMGLEVWALVNNMDNEIYGDSLKAVMNETTKRTRLVQELVTAVTAIGADGLNVDIESLPSDAGRGFLQFIRELSLVCHRQGLVLSVDNYVPTAWTAHYDRTEQGIFADYLIIMGYDEHYQGSEAGSSASLDFVTSGVEKTLAQVPAEKVILGVPFFTRVWKGSGAKPDSSLLNMNATAELLARYGAEPAWDSTTGQNFAEFSMEDGTRARVWIEDTESMAARLGAVRSSKLAGLAAWRLGMETPEIWDVFGRYFSGADLSQTAAP